MEAICSSEAYVDFQLTMRHYIAECGTLPFFAEVSRGFTHFVTIYLYSGSV
jgi:hypothetical protein